MLKGLVIAVSGADVLKAALKDSGLSWEEVKDNGEEGFCDAMAALGVKPEELICLVETDKEEKIALDKSVLCVGYLNPELKDEKLEGCNILLKSFEEVDADFLRNVYTRAQGLPVQIAETDRLLIREMTLDDLDDVDALYQEESSAKVIMPVSMERREEEERIQAYISYMYGLCQFGMWVIVEKKSKKVIGRAGFGIADYLDFSEVDLGYLIGEKYRHHGYAEEACRASLDYAREVLDFPQVSAYIDTDNEASVHLIEKLGFSRQKSFSYEGRPLYRYLLKFGNGQNTALPCTT